MSYLNYVIKTKIKHHNLNMFYSCGYGYEFETNWRIQQVMNDFINTYKDKLETHTFILDYKDDVMSLIAFKLLKAINGVSPFNLVLYGKKKKTKEMLPKEQKVIGEFGLKRLAKQGNIVIISAFNPLYQVVDKAEIFKHFDMDFKCWFNIKDQTFETFNVIDKFTPAQLRLMRVFYHVGYIDGDFFDDKEFEQTIINFQDWCDNKTTENGCAWSDMDYSFISDKYRQDYIKLLYLTDNLEDDKILLQSVENEDCIVLYHISYIGNKEIEKQLEQMLKEYSLFISSHTNAPIGIIQANERIVYANYGTKYLHDIKGSIHVPIKKISIYDIKEDKE